MQLRAVISLAIAGCAFMAQPSSAQWKKISDLGGESVSVVYFVDLPGPVRIGFVGANGIWKTTDGGSTWSKCLIFPFIDDIVFKDSLTGWAACWYSPAWPACYRTTDGGSTWTALSGAMGFGLSIGYSSSSHRLFLGLDSSTKYSDDDGNTWHDLPFTYAVGFSFSSGQDGIAMTGDTGHQGSFFITSDGGLTWRRGKSWVNAGDQPLAIPNSSICYAAGFGIFRSIDSGDTWGMISTFGADTGHLTWAIILTGVIRGDLSKLLVQSDSGIYYSLDSGVTWVLDNGSPFWNSNVAVCKFYRGKGVTIAGKLYSQQGGGKVNDGLWESIDPPSGVEENPVPPPCELSISLARATLTVRSPVSMLRVVLFDVLGSAVAALDVHESRTASMDVGALPAGVYFVHVTLGTGEVRTMELVKE